MCLLHLTQAVSARQPVPLLPTGSLCFTSIVQGSQQKAECGNLIFRERIIFSLSARSFSISHMCMGQW